MRKNIKKLQFLWVGTRREDRKNSLKMSVNGHLLPLIESGGENGS